MTDKVPDNPQSRTPESRQCPICHAPLNETQRVCWLCQQALERTDPAANAPLMTSPPNRPPPLPPPPPDYSFSLSTLMLAMTLVAVLSGLFAIAPGFAIPLGVLAVFAWILTARGTRQTANFTTGQKVVRFFQSFALLAITLCGAMAAMAAAMVAAFAAICYPMMGGRGHNDGYVYALAGAGVALLGGVVAFYAAKRLDRYDPHRTK